MLTRHRDRTFIHALWKGPSGQWIRARARPHLSTRTYPCQLAPRLASHLTAGPVCGSLRTPPPSTCAARLCVLQHKGNCKFSKPSHVFGSDASLLFIQPIRGCHFIPMETCLGPNWQIDLHDFDWNVFFFLSGFCLSLCVCPLDLSNARWECCIFCLLFVSVHSCKNRKNNN